MMKHTNDMNRFALSLILLLFISSLNARDVNPAAPARSAVELIRHMEDGTVTAESAVTQYLARIQALDRQGPELQAIISLNPDALDEARALDAERREGNLRGLLHGVPVLLKDNIESRELPTTAGSLALRDNDTRRDAPIVAQLRAAGAIILGKTNLSEWANFRSNSSISGWSGAGGQVRNPHSLDRSPCGSSSGSGAAAAAQYAPLTVGTETNGSIICPAAMNGVVGFKPTVGLLSRERIVPISSTQDTAGPMVRSVEDAALMTSVMAAMDPQFPGSKSADSLYQHYRAFSRADIGGTRVGVARFAQGKHPGLRREFDQALAHLAAAGAVLVDIESVDVPESLGEWEYLVLKTEFKATLNAYLEAAAPAVNARSLADLIEFNRDHAAREMVLFDQSIFIASQETAGLQDPVYLAALDNLLAATRGNGIDRLMSEHDVEFIVAPSMAPAFMIDVVAGDTFSGDEVGVTGLAAIAGYPALTVPMGSVRGLPVGLGIVGTAWDDARVLGLGYHYEQASMRIAAPTMAAGPFDHPATARAVRAPED